jgi:hypothetical protein
VAVAVAALVIILAAPAGAARSYKAPEANAPQWVLPNVIIVLMSLAVLAIPCKRFRRT